LRRYIGSIPGIRRVLPRCYCSNKPFHWTCQTLSAVRNGHLFSFHLKVRFCTLITNPDCEMIRLYTCCGADACIRSCCTNVCDSVLAALLEEMDGVLRGAVFGSVLDLDTLNVDLSPDVMIPGVAVASSRATPLAGEH
jgi:hypothetical protein